MAKILITGYRDRNDGPSSFINELSNELSSNHDLSFFDGRNLLHGSLNILKYDLFILNSHNLAGLFILILSFFSKKKIISVIHGLPKIYTGGYIKGKLHQIMIFLFFIRSDRVVFVSNLQRKSYLKRKFFRCFYKKTAVVYNNVKNKKNSIKNKDKIIIYAGGESYDKGFDISVGLIENLSNDNRLFGYKIMLLGMSDEYNFKKGFVEIICYKKLPNHQVLSLFELAECFLCLSRFETYGIAPVEALLRNCKVISYKNCGFLEKFESDSIFIADNYSQEGFFDAVIRALDCKNLSYNIRPINRRNKYTYGNYQEIIEELK